MPKRPNPYAKDFISQCKTHVGLKQFNNNEGRMRKVYEKTLQLLYKGAKKSLEEETKNLDLTPSARKECLKQLIISKDGSLVDSKITGTEIKQAAQECGCGSCGVESCCGYCEAPLCGACVRPCQRCHTSYCYKCLISGSEICFSCYG